MATPSHWLAVDVGTGSVRAAVADDAGDDRCKNQLLRCVHLFVLGHLICIETEDITTWHAGEDFYEQSSEEIWQKTSINRNTPIFNYFLLLSIFSDLSFGCETSDQQIKHCRLYPCRRL
jgi:hypothetical protein